MKNIKLAVIGIVCLILFGAPAYAQEANSNLHLPKELDGMGQMIHKGFDYMYSRSLEYVNANDVITKEGIDSVTRVSILDFTATLDSISPSHSMVGDILSGKKTQQDTPDSPELKAMQGEMLNVIKKSSGDLVQMAIQLGAINQKAAANLSDKEAAAIYAATCMTYYSATYWKDNMEKWQKFRDNAKKKIKK
jgi:hypothetical protein